MIIINSIIDDSLKWVKDINNLKTIFWGVFESSDYQNGMQQVFSMVSESRSNFIFHKTDLNKSLAIPDGDLRFADHFFFKNCPNENYMKFIDFECYFKRFLNNPMQSNYQNQQNTMQTQVISMIRNEMNFFQMVEPKKKNFRSNFGDEVSYFDFLSTLFEDLSTYSPRAKTQILDFAKFNTELRLKHGFPMLSMSDFSLLQIHFELNCDSGISLEEFLHLFMTYEFLQRFLQIRLHKDIAKTGNEPFFPFNKNEKNFQKNLNNFVIHDFKKNDQNQLKNLILKNMVEPKNTMDTFYVGTNTVYRQQDYSNQLKGDVGPQMIFVVDPNNPDVVPERQSYQSGLNVSGQEQKKLFINDLKVTQLTVDEELKKKDLIANLEEIESQHFISEQKPRPERRDLEESSEISLEKLDSFIRGNVNQYQY